MKADRIKDVKGDVMLEQTVQSIGPLDREAMAAAQNHQDCLALPPASLGRLHEFAVRMAGITGQPRPVVHDLAVITMAGDHGVAAQGVSKFPQEVTREMVANFARGGHQCTDPSCRRPVNRSRYGRCGAGDERCHQRGGDGSVCFTEDRPRYPGHLSGTRHEQKTGGAGIGSGHPGFYGRKRERVGRRGNGRHGNCQYDTIVGYRCCDS